MHLFSSALPHAHQTASKYAGITKKKKKKSLAIPWLEETRGENY